MFKAVKSLLERQIKKAEAEGQLSNLEREGKPLPQRLDLEDPALSTGHRIMAQAGVMPREFAVKEKLEDACKAYQACRTTPTANL